MSGSELPAFNASLNFVSGCLLLIGWMFIKYKKIELHKVCMISAFMVSSIFLCSYLYYHAHYGSTSFLGQGVIRRLYFMILVSHTILASVVPFLAIFVFYKAWKKQWELHRKIARWTLPIWLYVSFTGVVIYIMLYQIPGMS